MTRVNRPRLSPELFAILAALVERRAGLHYQATDAELLADKIAARADEAGFASLLDYYYYLRYDDPQGAEAAALVDALVVHETYLFREPDGLDALVERLATAVAAKQRARVWSAACSTGEEPYSVAMLLAERGILDRVDIVASDVSERALQRARAGVVTRRALERSPRRGLAEKYLEPAAAPGGASAPDGGRRVLPSILQAVRFRRCNLVDIDAYATLGCFDVILARNVFIYFRDETVRRIVDAMAKLLPVGGAVFVGVSESLLRFGTPLACVEQGGVFAYQKEPS